MRQTLAVLALVLSGCATYTPEQQKWYAERDRHPTSFSVEAEQLPEVMARAAYAIVREGISVLPILTTTERLIQTQQPPPDLVDARVGVTVTAMPQPSGRFLVEVTTRFSNPLKANYASRLARGVAFYANKGVYVP